MQAVVSHAQGILCPAGYRQVEDRIIAARYASPLVIGIGDGEIFAASDMTPILEHTERAIFLEDGDIASLTRKKCRDLQ